MGECRGTAGKCGTESSWHLQRARRTGFLSRPAVGSGLGCRRNPDQTSAGSSEISAAHSPKLSEAKLGTETGRILFIPFVAPVPVETCSQGFAGPLASARAGPWTTAR
jgi:hypothetical protein